MSIKPIVASARASTPARLAVTRLALPLLAIGALIACAPQATAEDTPPRTLSVSGEGEVSAPPDIAFISLGVVTTGDKASAALRANSAAMAEVFEVTRELGIEDRDVQTSNLSISPRYRSYPRGESGPPVIEGYTVSNQVTLRIRDLDNLGTALDRFVSGGANQLNGLIFSIDDADELMDEARRQAVADARARAELLAAEAGVSLGRVMSIHEQGISTPRPMAAARFETMADSVPVATGEQSLSAHVSITYEIE